LELQEFLGAIDLHHVHVEPGGELGGPEVGALLERGKDRRGEGVVGDGGADQLDEGEVLGALLLALLARDEDLLGVQTMLLTVLQEKAFRRMGGNMVPFSGLVIGTTNKPLDAIRPDLIRRCNVVEVPPLRARREDLGLLAKHVLVLAREREDPRAKHTDHLLYVLDELLAHDLPSNVSDLERLMLDGLRERAHGRGTPPVAQTSLPPPAPAPEAKEHVDGRLTLSPEQEAELVMRIKAMRYDNKSQADIQRELGLTRGQFRSLVERHGLK